MTGSICVGLSKGEVRASACVISGNDPIRDIEVFLKERLTRNKADGFPVSSILEKLRLDKHKKKILVAENSYNHRPSFYEQRLNLRVPYFDMLQQKGLQWSAAALNPALRFLTHHYCHALSAVEMSPFEKSLVVVIDGGGNNLGTFDENSRELKLKSFNEFKSKSKDQTTESVSVYLQDRASLRPAYKKWQYLSRDRASNQIVSEGLGVFYEGASALIFDSILDAGKVMGLAPFGKPLRDSIGNRARFIKGLDWSKAFKGQSKSAWEKSPHRAYYADVAATVQNHFEDSLIQLLRELRKKHSSYSNLILTGGCALNCVANMKILELGIFDKIYVSPFPGDECISLGAASYLKYSQAGTRWEPRPATQQTSAFGPKSSVPSDNEIERLFKGFNVKKSAAIEKLAAELLAKNKILGWYQGRSETGPRALGHRSILANPLIPGLQRHLNDRIKGRERFRPYGCSCLYEKAKDYFHVPSGFESPFMSFAPRVREKVKNDLKSVTHVDETSRIQTVRKEQDKRFYRLLKEFGDQTGLYCLLNTSLNVMGEPIVETLEDAVNFFSKVDVDAMVIGDFLITRSKR